MFSKLRWGLSARRSESAVNASLRRASKSVADTRRMPGTETIALKGNTQASSHGHRWTYHNLQLALARLSRDSPGYQLE
jgi:hypothetical protein